MKLIHLLRCHKVCSFDGWIGMGCRSREAGDGLHAQDFLYLTFPDDENIPSEFFSMPHSSAFSVSDYKTDGHLDSNKQSVPVAILVLFCLGWVQAGGGEELAEVCPCVALQEVGVGGFGKEF